jgi:hypothetical protein
MKKLIISIALLAIAISTFAGANSNNAGAEKNISASLKSQIIFPDFLKENMGEYTAAIFFKVTDCGEIVVKEIECDDPNLKANLLNQTKNIKVAAGGLDTRDTYKVIVRFETL